MMEPVEIILRLGSATLIGAAIGLNRDLRGKPIGVRTLGLVGLASAVAILATTYAGTDPRADAPSRVMQGVLTGVGFLGAGVIVRGRIEGRIHGLTSAASAWVTACLGLVCGVAAWPVAATGVALAFVVLVLGGPLERIIHRWLGGKSDVPPQPPHPPPQRSRDETQAR
jgi:putative Mg2+ transporter-C (MgtC) family protein